MARRRISGLTLLLLATFVQFDSASSAAAATPRDGVCDSGEVCLYYNSDMTGALSDFSGPITDYGFAQPSCYEFKGTAAGSGQCVQNNTASIWNRTARTVRIYTGRGFTGAHQNFGPGYSGNLGAAVKNRNASHDVFASGTRKPPAQLSLSAAGAAFIAAHEGFRSTVYNDVGGHCTIGYGHLIHRQACTAADRTTWKTITRHRGQELLAADAGGFVRGIRGRLADTPLTQYEFDALVSFTYNIGLGNFDTSSVWNDLQKAPADFAAVPAHLRLWAYSDKQFLCGLYKRRVHEGDLFSSGSYDAGRAVTCPAGQ